MRTWVRVAYYLVMTACVFYCMACRESSPDVRLDDLTKRTAALESIVGQVVPVLQRHDKMLRPQPVVTPEPSPSP